MAEIVPISAATALKGVHGEPCQDVVERLEELLADARSGFIRGFAYAAVTIDNGIIINWAGDASCWVLMGAVAKLQHDYLASDKETEDD